MSPLFPGVQVYVMKRMGGVQDTCHTCRLLAMHHVRNICDYYRIKLPSILDTLGRNEIPPGRKGTCRSCMSSGTSRVLFLWWYARHIQWLCTTSCCYIASARGIYNTVCLHAKYVYVLSVLLWLHVHGAGCTPFFQSYWSWISLLAFALQGWPNSTTRIYIATCLYANVLTQYPYM